MAPSFGSAWRSFWHTMTSSDRHASHDSPYRTGQHMPLNQSRHAPLTSVATTASDSRIDLNSPYPDDSGSRSMATFQNGWPGSPGALQSPTIPYSPGMRSVMQRKQSNDNSNNNNNNTNSSSSSNKNNDNINNNNTNPSDSITSGEIQMQSFQEGLPPPPPVSHSWKRIDRWAEAKYEELYDQLSEGCTQNDVNELEHELDCSLPMEVRESLQIHDGQERGGRPTGIIFGCMLLDCEEIVQEWKNWRVVNEEYLTAPVHQQLQAPAKAFGGSSSASNSLSHQATNPLWRQELLDRQDSQPPRAIQRAYVHPGWIPLARDWGGNNIAVDLAPGSAGKWGQIIIFGRDYDCKYVIARSWSAFLATVADDLCSEKVFVEEESQELKLREFKTPGIEPAYLDILRWRMDQKYGRKGPRRKSATDHRSTSGGSPYGSPTNEERGRSPNRFPGRGPNSSSPRRTMGKSSPLAKVSEETPAPIAIHTGGDANSDPFATETAVSERNGRLVGAMTPTEGDDESRQKILGPVMDAVILDTDDDKENKKESMITGLGVEGLDEMKSVDI